VVTVYFICYIYNRNLSNSPNGKSADENRRIFAFYKRMKKKLNLNFHITWLEVIKHILRIVFAVLAVWAFNKYFPQNILPKDFIFKTAVYACIYVLVSLVLEVIFKKIEKLE
jgi:ABC-type xylose transport system permease subunit